MNADSTLAPDAAPPMDAAIGFRSFGAPARGRAPIVVLPGLGVSRYMRPACAELAQTWQRQVLLVDPPGFGTSSRALTGRVTLRAVVDRLRPWLRQWGPVLLVGQSTGSLLAAALSLGDDGTPNEAVRALALVGPAFDPDRSTLRSAALGLLEDGAAEPWWLGPSEAPEWILNARSLPSYLRSCLAADLEEQLADVSCDVVVVRGDRDPLSRHEWASRLADAPRRTSVAVPGGAHTFMADRPSMLLASLGVGRFGFDTRERM